MIKIPTDIFKKLGSFLKRTEPVIVGEITWRDTVAKVMVPGVWIAFGAFTFIALVSLFFVLVLYSWVFLVCFFVTTAIAIFMISFVKVVSTEKPRQVAIVRIFEKNTSVYVKDGLQLEAPYLGMRFSTQTVEYQTLSVVLKGVPCKFKKEDTESAVDVDVEATILFGADQTRLLDIVKHGGIENVGKLLNEMFEEDYRQFAFARTYQELGEAKDEATVALILNLVALGAGYKPELKEYYDMKVSSNVAEKKQILERVLANGIADEHYLGIKIKRVNFSKVEPGEKTKRVLKEAEEKRTQEIQAETFKLLSEMYRKMFPKLSDEKISDMILIQDNHIKKIIVQIDGGNGEKNDVGDIAKAAALLVAKDTLATDTSSKTNN